MEDLNSLEEVENDNQIEDNKDIEEDEELSDNNKNIEKEIEIEDKYWSSYFIKNYVYVPNKCPICNKSNITIDSLKNILNPKRLICINYKCRFRGNLRKYSLMSQFPRQQASVIMKIIKLFIIDEKKGTKIQKTLKQEYDINISLVTIERILTWTKRAFAHYIKDNYKCNKLGKRSGNSNISMDESLFTYDNSQKIWIVGCKNNYTENIRVDIFKSRNTND